jgi:glycosyltransferase involved in cell wall biosynthesis
VSLVSCIVTTCDRPDLVGRAVASVLAQTLSGLELIVVVDGPDAATERVLGEHRDPRMHVVVRPTRGGQGAALNTGIARERGLPDHVGEAQRAGRGRRLCGRAAGRAGGVGGV